MRTTRNLGGPRHKSAGALSGRRDGHQRIARRGHLPRPVLARAQSSLPEPSERRPSDPQDRTSASSSSEVSVGAFKLSRAASAARLFYDCINRGEVGKATDLFASDCLFEDLNEPVPSETREQVDDFIEKTYGGLADGTAFVVDELSDGETSMGLTWHLERNGTPVPNGRGCTFLRINEGGKIAYVRDLIEPESKPGEAAFTIMKVVLPLLKNVDTSSVTNWTPNRRPAGAAEGSAAQVVRAFYDHINDKEVDRAMEYFAEDCLYEDLNFPAPYRGFEEVKRLMRESCDSIPGDLVFVIDDISDGAGAVGVTWHLELGGKPFPFSRGCSLYKVSRGKIVYARDLVEPSGKQSKRLPVSAEVTAASAAFTAAAAVYTLLLILSPPDLLVPGDGLFWIKQETLDEIAGSSYNFFFVAPALDALGIHLPLVPEPLPAYHPCKLALFNFVNAWSFMFLPLLLRDNKSTGMNKAGWWSVQMFLTNAVLMPFLARREANRPTLARVQAAEAEAKQNDNLKFLSKSFGIVGGIVGAGCFYWFAAARPEFGDFGARVEYWWRYVSTDRVAFAFCVDMALYSVWQPFLISAVEKQEGMKPDPIKFVPFFGLCKWLQTSSGLRLLDEEKKKK